MGKTYKTWEFEIEMSNQSPITYMALVNESKPPFWQRLLISIRYIITGEFDDKKVLGVWEIGKGD